MKRGLAFSLLVAIFNLGLILTGDLVFASVQDFSFSDFTADYYVTKDKDGISQMRVVEKLTAQFPNHSQNKGICRMIPFLNNGGTNVTLGNLTKSDIKVLRNGEAEPIYSIERAGDYYEVCTGTDDYLLGTQTYTLEYNFSKVITEYNEAGEIWQELYWDTNGTGWKQSFKELTARVHFSDKEVLNGETSCYVGKYGENGSERCVTAEIADGFQFTTKNLGAQENLTFDIGIKAGSFIVPGPEKSYAMLAILGLVILITATITTYYLRKNKLIKEKKNFYKGYFVKPEYQPHTQYNLAEMAQVYIGKIRGMNVAILLKMIIDGRIEIKKGEKKALGGYNWEISIKNLERAREEEKSILAILKGGEDVRVGESIKLERHKANSELVELGKKVEQAGVEDAKRDGLVEKEFTKRTNVGENEITTWIKAILVFGIIIFAFARIAVDVVMRMVALTVGSNGNVYTGEGKILVGFWQIMVIVVIIIAVGIALLIIIKANVKKYKNRTLKGLEISRYMDGLKMYIEMAEKDRIQFLQSVEGADTSANGVVKLYEKLLPYAALFGVEESWMEELSKYYNMDEVERPGWSMAYDTMMMTELAHTVRMASTISYTSSHYSSDGSSSSGFSGGGGGGFSGGGGGGGGGGGR